MDTFWFNKLLDVLKIQTNSENEKLMILYLDRELRKLKLPYHIDAAGNVLVIKGKAGIYPCVVSHMDTVHNFVSNFEVYTDIDDKDILFAKNGEQRIGIGGDDKCGVFACLHLLKVIPVIKVVFFSREESGCRGSRNINMKFFTDCSYVIQLDRRGKGDFIQTYWGRKTISHEFSSEIGLIKRAYKYKNTTGTVTDVMKLWDSEVGVSCINLSCGYYQPHSDHEYISVRDLWHSVKFTEEIIHTMQAKKYPSCPPKQTVTTVSYAASTLPSTYDQCSKCHKWKKEVLLYEIKGSGGKKVCWPCKKEQYDKKEKKNDTPLVANDNKVVPFANYCYDCGALPSELAPGSSLKTVDGHLYCDKCASVHTVFNNKPVKCYVCNRVIPKDHKIIKRFGTQVCEDCCCPSDTIIN